MEKKALEPWLRGTHVEIAPVQRAVVHALELAREDVQRWVLALPEEELAARPHGLSSLAFQVRHVVRSLDRLLTYAEGAGLTAAQLAALRSEEDMPVDAEELRAEFVAGVSRAMERVLRFSPERFEEARGVGRAGLPTTVVGLLIHAAEHTQRHVGQAVTTAKVLRAVQELQQS